MSAGSAIPIRTLGIATAILLIPLAYHASHAIGALEAERSALQMLRGAGGRDAAGLATDRLKEWDRLRAQLRRAAREQGVTLRAEARAGGGENGLMVVRIDATGSQAAILAFADASETGARGVRFRAWRVDRAPGGVRLTGEAVALAGDWR